MEQTTEEIKAFWDHIIRNPDGSINEEQLFKELADYSFVLSQVPKVYMHITNDLLSKPNYLADGVIGKADECYREQYIEIVKDFIDDLVLDEYIKQEDKAAVIDQIENCL